MVVTTFSSKGKAKGKRGIFRKGRRKIPSHSLVVFTRQFATIVKTAVPIVEGLMVLSEQSEDIRLKGALRQVVSDVSEGNKLSQAFSKHPDIFSEFYVNTVIAGEEGGILDKILLRLANVMEEEQERKAAVDSALRYPKMVVVTLVLAFLIVSIKVIPEFARLYRNFGVSLPFPTQIMIGISDFVRGPWRDSPYILLRILWYFLFVGIFGGLSFFCKWLINTPRGRNWWDGLKFKMAVVGKVYNKMVMFRFACGFNLLYQAGLPILKIFETVKGTVGNVVLAKEIGVIQDVVAEGGEISQGILRCKFFPRMVVYLISVGEKTGSLSEMLDALCEYFSLEIKVAVRNLISLIEPLLILCLAVTVAFFALAIFLPLWNLISLFKSGI